MHIHFVLLFLLLGLILCVLVALKIYNLLDAWGLVGFWNLTAEMKAFVLEFDLIGFIDLDLFNLE